jgi:hypothetical protein
VREAVANEPKTVGYHFDVTDDIPIIEEPGIEVQIGKLVMQFNQEVVQTAAEVGTRLVGALADSKRGIQFLVEIEELGVLHVGVSEEWQGGRA